MEWLTVQVADETAATRYLAADAAVWTPFLVAQAAFRRKEIWRDPTQPRQLTLVIHWASRRAWKAIPAADLARVEQAFNAAYAAPYQVIVQREFHPVPEHGVGTPPREQGP